MGCSLSNRVHNQPQPTLLYSVAFLGPSNCGKTSIIRALEIKLDKFKDRNSRQREGLFVRNVLLGRIAHAIDVAKILAVGTDLETALTAEQTELFERLDKAGFDGDPDLEAIFSLVDDSTIQKVCEQAGAPMSQDEVNFARNVVKRFAQSTYEPSDDELMRLQWPTRGVQRRTVVLNGKLVQLIDVAGSPNKQIKSTLRQQSLNIAHVVLVLPLETLLATESTPNEIIHDSIKFEEAMINLETALDVCGHENVSLSAFLTGKDQLEAALNPGGPNEQGICLGDKVLKDINEVIEECERSMSAMAAKRSKSFIAFYAVNSSSITSMREQLTSFIEHVASQCR